MLESVKSLAVADPFERRIALLNLLREARLPFVVQHEKIGTHDIENIVIAFAPSEKRLVIGAHYDSVLCSTGANDNASGVCVLIALAQRLMKQGATNIEIVFFDREEYEDHGSEAFIISVGADNIGAMINIDMCGFGDTIGLVAKGNIGNPKFRNLMMHDVLTKHHVACCDTLPFNFGDDLRFDEHHIDNIAVTTLPHHELELVMNIIEATKQGQRISDEQRAEMRKLDTAKTFHNGEWDNIAAVSESALTMTLAYLVDGIAYMDVSPCPCI